MESRFRQKGVGAPSPLKRHNGCNSEYVAPSREQCYSLVYTAQYQQQRCIKHRHFESDITLALNASFN